MASAKVRAVTPNGMSKALMHIVRYSNGAVLCSWRLLSLSLSLLFFYFILFYFLFLFFIFIFFYLEACSNIQFKKFSFQNRPHESLQTAELVAGPRLQARTSWRRSRSIADPIAHKSDHQQLDHSDVKQHLITLYDQQYLSLPVRLLVVLT